jgi:methionyl-tRNA synthetase
MTDECFYTDAQVTTSTSSTTATPTKVSIETGAVVEWHNEQNYMFKLTQFQPSLLAHYSSNNTIFPPQHHSHIVQILLELLEDLPMSPPHARAELGHAGSGPYDIRLVRCTDGVPAWDGISVER